MNRRRLLYLGGPWALLSRLAFARDAALPRQNLVVELRWVRSPAVGNAPADTGLAPLSHGIAGSTTSTSSTTIGTLRGESTPFHRIVVLNGESASVSLADQAPAQWLDYAIDLHAAPQPMPQPRSSSATSTPRRRAVKAAAASGANSLPGTPIEVLAAPRTASIERHRGLVVGLRWPGGREPVRVEVNATVATGSESTPGQMQIMTTLAAELGRWQTVACGHPPDTRQSDGTVVSTQDIDAAQSRDLQLRVGLAR